ncbi:NAD(P)/FAD-dependent oxidoreductase [Cytobacillus spongiae]|uniref:NAD(P)/FAD-dependent oxidoreductase n=1 Tax=Cytobacillus spongiae TaxID=2901381 RepID=UPI001F2078E6|nr:NAD(P)/FAD-dependent oxidoreductase [Cytobacillus spongiae]UII55499.1 NAD(P)/FAD-dependent oxidoreductase [Cytobacillus spongiae]
MNKNQFECVIVGGGAAGLSAGLILGRSKRKVMIIDENKPRNRVTHASHGFLSRDGIDPREFKRISIEQLKKYPNVIYQKSRVEHVDKQDDMFILTTNDGELFHSKRVIFSTGMKEKLPKIKGLREVYGTSVFPCPYCDGWERKDEPLAIIGSGEWLMHYVKLIYHWSKDVIVFTNGPANLSMEEKAECQARQIQVVETVISELKSTNGKLEEIVLETGKTYLRTSGFLLNTGEVQASTIPQQMGIVQDEMGGYVTSEIGETKVKGLYIIGDAKNTFSGVIKAASEGYEIGAKINGEMVEEDWKSN